MNKFYLLLVVLVAVSATGYAYAQVGGDMVKACVKKNGEVRLIVPGFTQISECEKKNVSIDLNTAGEVETYVNTVEGVFESPGELEVKRTVLEVYCNTGDIALGGGFSSVPSDNNVTFRSAEVSAPIVDENTHQAIGWRVIAPNREDDVPATVSAICLKK